MNTFTDIKPEELDDNIFKLIGTDWMLVTASNGGKTNTMTASWGGAGIMWHKNVAFIVIRPQRYTKEFIDASDSLTLSFFDSSYKKILSYLGTVSGRDEDKIANSKLTLNEDSDAPYFDEARLVLVCKKLYAQNLDKTCLIDESIATTWYPSDDYHTLYIAEITNVLKR